MTRQQRPPITPTLSASELTKSTWSKPIKSYDLVPQVYKDFFDVFLADGNEFPYTVLTPSFERFIRKTTEMLICDGGSDIYVLKRTGNSYEAACYPLSGISYVEMKIMLLDSHIKISGVTKDGVSASSTIRFNTVTDYLFTPILEKIRLAAFDSRGTTQSLELEKFDYLLNLNFKFMNYAKHSLTAGEKVIQNVLQPEIREGVLKIMGRTFYRTISPTHMSILTDQELIMIRENEGRGGENKYGGVWNYIPLKKIVSASLIQKDSNRLVFSIELPGGEHLEYLFSDTLRQDVNQLLVELQALTSAEQYLSTTLGQVLATQS